MVDGSTAWGVLLLPVLLGLLAYIAAALDAALGAVMSGRAAVEGIAAPAREVARLMVRQRRTTVLPDALVWRLGAAGVLVVAVLASVVTPFGRWATADLQIGVVWWTAFMALLWALMWLAGWGGNSVLSMTGGYRFLAQALAYEMPLAISVISAATAAGSLRVGAIVAGQRQLWYVVWMPAALAVYLVCALAIAFWGPLSTPVGRDLAGGVQAELSGVDRLVFLTGRYVLLAAVAAFAVPLYLGGGLGPVFPPEVWLLLKTLAVLALLVAARWRLPAVRMDRFESFSWVVLLPVAIIQSFLVAVVVLVA